MAISDSEKAKLQADNATTTTENCRLIDKTAASNTSTSNMEYNWLEPKHDPIATDTNLAEIDFEDFRNEDLAYAFSCGVRDISQTFFLKKIFFCSFFV